MRLLRETSFEVIFYSTWFGDAPAIARSIVATGSPTPVLHAEKSIGPGLISASVSERANAFDKFVTNCRCARTIGAHLVVLHLWGLPDSDTRLEQNLTALPQLLDVADRYGLTVSIETLLCQVSTPVDAVTRCREVDDRAGITLDTAFLAMHDQLDASVTDDRLWLTDGVDHVHVKDYANPRLGWGKAGYLHPGEGALDLAGFMKGLRTRGYAGAVTLEAHALREDNLPDVERIEASLDWIRRTQTEASGGHEGHSSRSRA